MAICRQADGFFYFTLAAMYISLNGKMVKADEPVFLSSNRGYRYGDGLFETIKIKNGKILLGEYHFERLFSGLQLLKFELPGLFTRDNLVKGIIHLYEKNNCASLARVRLSVFRGNGGLNDGDTIASYLAECWPLNESQNRINENGLVADIFPDARKSCDIFSNLKSANYLPYAMAARFAKENKLNDCFVLNSAGRIADSTIANIFCIKDGVITTPGLSEGCVNGVMRRHLLAALNDAGYDVKEQAVTAEDIEMADEVFLTNAISGIRWVKQFRKKTYSNQQTTEIYNRFVKTI